MFDQTLIRICLIFGSLVTAWYILRRVRQAKVQIEDTIFWLLFSAALLILAIFPGIAYWAANLLGFMSPINFVYVVIIFLLLAKQFFMSIRLSQLDSKVRILTEQVALNEEKVEREKLDSPFSVTYVQNFLYFNMNACPGQVSNVNDLA